MLSTKPVKDVQQASHYFLGQDNYYNEENTLAQERSRWWGRGAEAMGLSGSVSPEQFTALLQGHLPNGEQLGKKVDGEIHHRPGFDLTFSVPKSVSILALLGEDERIFKAINEATDKTLALIEREQAKTRVKKDGVLMTERTGQLVVAKFLHDLSRDGDPQLHTHCVVMNMTLRKDGQWRSLASKLGNYQEKSSHVPQGFLEEVRHYQKYYGAVFRAELAYALRELGYTVEKSGAYGFFEIAGISKESIQVFSQRRQSIENYLKSHGLSGAKFSELATLKTRRAKEHLDREELKSIWEARAALQGLLPTQEAQRTIAQALQKTSSLTENGSLRMSADLPEQANSTHPIHPTNLRVSAQTAIREAIAHLSETQVALRETEIVAKALHYSMGDTPVAAICSALQSAERNSDLITLEMSVRHERHFTTSALLQDEKDLLQGISQRHSSGIGMVKDNLLTAFLREHSDLTTDQQQALKKLFSSDKTLMSLIGPTGSGKTHLLSSMMTLAKMGGYQPIVLTNRQVETLDLKQYLQKTPVNLQEWVRQLFDKKQLETVFSFLRRQESQSTLENWLQKKPLLLVENATQLSTRQMNQLRVQSERLNGRCIFIGDPDAPQTWRAGSPLTQLLSHGLVAAQLSDHPRQKSTALQSALADSLQKNIAAAFQKIDQRILSIEQADARWEAMAAHFSGLSETERMRTAVLAPTQATAQALNQAIHAALQMTGSIAQENKEMTFLLPHFLRPAEQKNASHYQAGQWIRFHQDYRSARVHRGDYRRIESIDQKTNELLLSNDRGKIRRWNPDKVKAGVVEVFDEKKRAIAVGDTLICHRTHQKQGVVKGERVTVTAITEKELRLKTESGKILPAWSLKDMSSRHFDYGYALTPLQATHLKPDIVLAYQSSGARQSHQRAFYQILASAKEQAWIYTENKAQLLKTLQKQSGNKLTAIDALLHDQAAGRNASEHIQLLETAVERAIRQQRSGVGSPSPATIAKEAVQFALAYLSEKEAAFAHKEVMTVALTHVLGQVNLQALQQAVVEAEKRGDLIRGVYSHQGTRWTTREALSLERRIVALAQADRGSLPLLASPEVTEAYLQSAQPSTEHARVLRELSAQTDRIVLLQGFAGTGKTTLLQHVETLQAIQGGLPSGQPALLCLAPTHTAVKEIRARGLLGQTLDRFLLNYQAGKITPEDFRHRLLVVDEASMISNGRLHDFLAAVTQLGTRGLLVGDNRQYTAIDNGKPFDILQQIKLSTLHLTEITRQKDETLKSAVKLLYQKEFAQVFKTLENHIIEVGSYRIDDQKADDRAARLEKIAADYLDREADRRAQTLIITFGNQDRILQNALIREGLQQRGELTGEAVNAAILVPRSLSEVERSQVMHYRIGDVLRFNLGDTALSIQKGDYWTVSEVLLEQRWLKLTPLGQSDRPEAILWKPRSWHSGERAGVEVYHSEKRELMAGDLIRWTRTDEALGLLSPELARVDTIHDGKVTVRSLTLTDQGLTPQGKPIDLAITHPRLQHWDHAYAMTGYSAQGKTIREVMINAESWRRQLTSQPSLLVALTRAVYHLTLYTDDKEALLQAVMNNPGVKSSALEIMGEASPLRVSFSTSSAQPALPSKQASRPAIPRENESSKWPTEPRLDAHRISHLLTDQAEQVLERLLGEPKTKTGGQYRYGARQGSLVVTLAGDKRGLWHDFQTGEGGHLLKLIALQKNLDIQRDFQAVLREALVILGTSPADLSVQAAAPATHNQSPVSVNREASSPTPEQQRSLRYAQQLARESQPVAGTLAERYLREHRGIALNAFPDSFRFHPGIYSRKNEAAYPALLVVAKDGADKVQAVQAIFLEAETARKADVPVKKQTWGRPSLGSVTLGQSSPSGITQKTYLAEGPETALSVYAALAGADVRITLGKSNFKNIDPITTQSNVVLCLDNDGQKSQSDRLIHFAAEKLQEQGKAVWIAQPKIEGWDYNDMLRHQGLAAVKQELQQAVSYSDYQDQIKPGVILQKESSIDAGEKRLSDRELSVDKNGVAHQKIKPEKQPELEM